jgi:hypothetical protein
MSSSSIGRHLASSSFFPLQLELIRVKLFALHPEEALDLAEHIPLTLALGRENNAQLQQLHTRPHTAHRSHRHTHRDRHVSKSSSATHPSEDSREVLVEGLVVLGIELDVLAEGGLLHQGQVCGQHHQRAVLVLVLLGTSPFL